MSTLPTNLKKYSIVADNIRDNIYIIGGQIGHGDTDSIYIFDTENNQLIKSNINLKIPRSEAKIIILNNVIYIMGGSNHKTDVISDIETIRIIDKYTLGESRII